MGPEPESSGKLHPTKGLMKLQLDFNGAGAGKLRKTL